jgi:peptidoglycan-N-acetylglucosamine deacetylase
VRIKHRPDIAGQAARTFPSAAIARSMRRADQAEAPMSTKHPDGEPWQWPESTWRKIVGRARAGRSLKPRAWPNGARCAVAISFDADHETIPLRDGDESPMRISQGQYGQRQATPRIRALLQREAIPASFFYPAVSALLHPEEVRGIADDGHEIGIHSWIHEANTTLPREVERDLTFRAAETLSRISGRDPVGMRTASWDFSVNTMDIIRELKLLYDSSLMADDDPYELMDDGEPTGVVELPPEWIRDDAVYYNFVRFSALRPYTPPSAVEEIFTGEFDGAWQEGGLFLLTMHPHITGHRSRLPVLERLIKHMKARGSCWFATHAQIARWCKDDAM